MQTKQIDHVLGKPYSVPRERSRWPSLGLALAMHLGLLFFLWVGVHWQNTEPVAVEAEVWDMQVQTAAPAPEVTTEPEPTPADKPMDDAPESPSPDKGDPVTIDGAAQAAEDVELPGGVEAGVVERALGAEGGAAGDAAGRADAGRTLGRSGVAAGPRSTQGGPGGVEIGVGRQRVGDEGRQLRVGQLFPPVGEALR